MTTTLSSKGQLVIPAAIRKLDDIRPGQPFSIERLEDGRYLLEKQDIQATHGLMNWLLRCPEKGWFQEIPSESTDTL